MRIELHCHSTASDGRLTPTELLDLAASRSVTTLALTDHDTIAGHAEAMTAGSAHNIRVIGGIEVSTLFEGKEAHILGYGVRPSDDATRATLDALRSVRESRARAMLAKLSEQRIHVSYERVCALAGDGMLGRPHIARAMLEAGVVTSIQDAFDGYLAEGKSAFVANDALTPGEAAALIHRAHGCVVLAHPGLFHGKFDTLFQHLLKAGLDGIETYYPEHTASQMDAFAALARSQGLIVTGGSDFHIENGHHAAALGDMQLPDGCLDALDARIARYA